MVYDCPIHNERRLTFSSPEGLKRILLQDYPLTKEFIDWVVEQGFKIIYQPDLKEGNGLVFGGWGPRERREIWVSSQGKASLKDKVLVHELIHISVPGNHEPREDYEKTIDQIADIYLNDSEFMKYLKKKMPVLKTAQK